MKTETEAWDWMAYLYTGKENNEKMCDMIWNMYKYGAISQSTHNSMNRRLETNPNYVKGSYDPFYPVDPFDRESRGKWCAEQASLTRCDCELPIATSVTVMECLP